MRFLTALRIRHRALRHGDSAARSRFRFSPIGMLGGPRSAATRGCGVEGDGMSTVEALPRAESAPAQRGEVILEVRNLVKHFEAGGGFLGGHASVVKAVD